MSYYHYDIKNKRRYKALYRKLLDKKGELDKVVISCLDHNKHHVAYYIQELKTCGTQQDELNWYAPEALSHIRELDPIAYGQILGIAKDC